MHWPRYFVSQCLTEGYPAMETEISDALKTHVTKEMTLIC